MPIHRTPFTNTTHSTPNAGSGPPVPAVRYAGAGRDNPLQRPASPPAPVDSTPLPAENATPVPVGDSTPVPVENAATHPAPIPASPAASSDGPPPRTVESLQPSRRRRTGRRIEDAFTVAPQPPGLVLTLHHPRPAVALCVQYRPPVRRGGRLRPGGDFGGGPVLSVSAAATFGQREPGTPATVAVLLPNGAAPFVLPLKRVLALVLREAACSPARFRETGLDVYLCAPDPLGGDADRAFGLTLSLAPFPREAALIVSDLAGRQYRVPATLHDLTPALRDGGLRDMQVLTDPIVPAPDRAGHVGQDLGALLAADPEEYRRVAAHQVCLALFYGCRLYGRI